MAQFAKGILVAMLAMVALVLLMNMAFFLPWYITVVETAFEVSQAVSNDNYLTYESYNDIYGELKDRPIFNKRNSDSELYIKVTHYDGRDGIERYSNNVENYYGRESRPYVQRGYTATVKIHATYPLQMQLGGQDINKLVGGLDIPVDFTMKTTTLKHYKDLDYYLR